jgi:hypothetical protein
MQGRLSVCWHITAQDIPRVRRHCAHCRGKQLFACSGKFRINAQKQRLDVWLIYRCSACEATWNYPIFERCGVNDIDAGLLAAMTANSPAAARRLASDVANLGRYVNVVEPAPELLVEKRVEGEAPADPQSLCITLSLPVPSGLRLDRMLATQLRLSRSLLPHLQAEGCLTITPPSRAALKRPLRDGQRIEFDLRALADRPEMRQAIIAGAC